MESLARTRRTRCSQRSALVRVEGLGVAGKDKECSARDSQTAHEGREGECEGERSMRELVLPPTPHHNRRCSGDVRMLHMLGRVRG